VKEVKEVASVGSGSFDAVISKLWRLYATLGKKNTDNAVKEVYEIMSDINHLIVGMVAVKPTEPFLRDRLVAYENAFNDSVKHLVANIRLGRVYRSRADILEIIRIVMALAKESEIYSVILRGNTTTAGGGS
jgi:hypothetical protein